LIAGKLASEMMMCERIIVLVIIVVFSVATAETSTSEALFLDNSHAQDQPFDARA